MIVKIKMLMQETVYAKLLNVIIQNKIVNETAQSVYTISSYTYTIVQVIP